MGEKKALVCKIGEDIFHCLVITDEAFTCDEVPIKHYINKMDTFCQILAIAICCNQTCMNRKRKRKEAMRILEMTAMGPWFIAQKGELEKYLFGDHQFIASDTLHLEMIS